MEFEQRVGWVGGLGNGKRAIARRAQTKAGAVLEAAQRPVCRARCPMRGDANEALANVALANPQCDGGCDTKRPRQGATGSVVSHRYVFHGPCASPLTPTACHLQPSRSAQRRAGVMLCVVCSDRPERLIGRASVCLWNAGGERERPRCQGNVESNVPGRSTRCIGL